MNFAPPRQVTVSHLRKMVSDSLSDDELSFFKAANDF